MNCLATVTRENFPRFQNELLAIENSSFPSPWGAGSFSSEIDREISHFWVLTIDEVLAGYICFWIFAGEVHLLNVAVEKDCRRKGVARQLLSKMFDEGKRENAETAWLEVRPSNLAARSLYKKSGFREVGRRLRYYADTSEDAIIMSMALKENRKNERQDGYNGDQRH
jgi:ribosomal-protein-alanine N-acetyltransferase